MTLWQVLITFHLMFTGCRWRACGISQPPHLLDSECQYRDKVELQFNGSETRRMWQGLQTITDYKRKTSHVADTNVLLPNKLNSLFARFEDNTVPPKLPATKDCGLSFSVADVSKTFKHVNPRKVAGPDGRPCADQPRWCVYRHIKSLPIPVCCPHMLQDGHHCSCTLECKSNSTIWLPPHSTHFCHHEVLWETSQGSYHLQLTGHPRPTSICLPPQ